METIKMANPADVTRRKHWFRFSIRSLIVAITFVAFSVMLIQWYLVLQNSKPIDTVIQQFNEEIRVRHSKITLNEPALTTSRVLEFLASNDKYLNDAPPYYAAVFRGITKTKRIPNNTTFKFLPMGTSEDGTPRFGVAMDVINGYAGYTVIVVENDLLE